MRWKDALGPKQDWLVVGLLLALVIIPLFLAGGLSLLIAFKVASVTGIAPDRVLFITAAGFLAWGLLRRTGRGRQ